MKVGQRAAGLSILAAGASRDMRFAAQLHLGNHPKLPHRPKIVIVTPMFDDLVVGDRHRCIPVVVKCTPVGAMPKNSPLCVPV